MIKAKGKKKIGLALGGGSALGLCHIGILEILEKNGIYPDYIAGTSMGAVVGALYCAGKSPEEIKRIAQGTDWKAIVDFDVPKFGLIKGKLIEKRIRELVDNKKFSQLNPKLNVVAYNYSQKEEVVFSKGDVTEAVRASMSIPGIFNPVKIGKDKYIDGGVSNPTPFDVVKEMGADIVIAVDLCQRTKTGKSPVVKRITFYDEIKKMFIVEELLNIKNYIFPSRWPGFIKKTLIWLFDKLLYPAKVLRMATGRKTPEITKMMVETFQLLSNNLARERIKHADVELKVIPDLSDFNWMGFENVNGIIELGEKAMKKEMFKLKKLL